MSIISQQNAVIMGQVTTDMYKVASNPSVIPAYYQTRTADAAKLYAVSYLRGDLFSAGVSASSVLYDISAIATVTNGTAKFATKNLQHVVKQTSNFLGANNVRSPIVFQYNARLNSGFPIDEVKFQKPVVEKPIQPTSSASYNANNVNAQASLNQKLRALQKAQKTAARTQEFSDGRIRYYTAEQPSNTPGPTRGRSHVTEFNPNTGQVRAWAECYDQQGNVNRIHPKIIDGQTVHGQHYPLTKSELESIAKKTEGPQ